MSDEQQLSPVDGYGAILEDVAALLDTARHLTARSVNALMTASYWAIGRRIVEHEQQGEARAEYGESLVAQLSADLTDRFGRGFSKSNLFQMRAFYLGYREIFQTASGKFADPAPGQVLRTAPPELTTPSAGQIVQTASGKSPHDELRALASRFPLPWSHYVKLLAVDDPAARAFYEAEAIRGGWTVRQLARQIGSQYYQRALLSKNKAALLRKGAEPLPADAVTPEGEIRDPYVLEFLDLKDEYSESDLEAALIGKLETFLLELGGDFAFIGRQRRLRIGDEWYRVDLLFYHRRLRCLVVIDLKLGKFTHADAGQMHVYLNYAREHWTLEGENPPVGLILCAEKDHALARYALEGLPNKVLAAEYRMTLPDEATLVAELERTQAELARRRNLLTAAGEAGGGEPR